LHADIGGHALRRDWVAFVLLLVSREIGCGTRPIRSGLIGTRIGDDRDALKVFGAQCIEGLEGVASADQKDRLRRETLIPHGAQEEIAVWHVAGVDPYVGGRGLGAQHRVGQVGCAEIVRADADDLRTGFLEQFLLTLRYRGAVNRILAFDPDLQPFHVLAECRREQFARGVRRHFGKARRVRPAANEVRQAAFGQIGGKRVRVPVELAVTQRRVARGVRHHADIGADEDVDLVADKLLDRRYALLRV
jgi:hypothetical protein